MGDDLPFVWPAQLNPPKRPWVRDPEVIRLAAEKATDAIINDWNDFAADANNMDHEGIVNDLIDALSRSDDGYAICKRLENLYWSPDAELVDIVDGGFLSIAHGEAVRQWVDVYGIKPPLTIGTHIVCQHGVGVIVGIVLDYAEYTIQTKETECKYLVEYEKVQTDK